MDTHQWQKISIQWRLSNFVIRVKHRQCIHIHLGTHQWSSGRVTQHPQEEVPNDISLGARLQLAIQIQEYVEIVHSNATVISLLRFNSGFTRKLFKRLSLKRGYLLLCCREAFLELEHVCFLISLGRCWISWYVVEESYLFASRFPANDIISEGVPTKT